jgi:phosphoribosylformylglycinamidine (FGAM) synthase-like enzyme
VDHLQFGNPENEQIFWTFLESIRAIRDFCTFMKIPVVGGKVSLYNETKSGSIKPSPVIGALGLVENKAWIRSPIFEACERIFIMGMTYDELGGSEYYEYYHKSVGGIVPKVNLGNHKKIVESVKTMVKANMVSAIHDCSKGGFIISLLEISIHSNRGFVVDIGQIPTSCTRLDHTLFSESHGRFIFSSKNPENVKGFLMQRKIPFADIGIITSDEKCILKFNNKTIADLPLSDIIKMYEGSLLAILEKKATQ